MRRILRVGTITRLRSDLTTQRVWLNRHIQHAFDIPWQALTPANRTALDAFFQSCRGRYASDISFTDPWDSVAYTCRLDSDELALEEAEAGKWNASIRLVEVSGFKTLKSPVATFPALSSGAVVELPYRMSRRYGTILQSQLDDAEKRYEGFNDAAGLQRWAVGGQALSDDEAEDLLDCWEGNGGPYLDFSFTEPETNTGYTVHFMESQIEHCLIEYNCNQVRTMVEELRAAA
jgi:hypothetical protein